MNKSTPVTPPDRAEPMTFQESLRVCFVKFADFTGRASRPEFWWFALFVLLLTSAFTYISETAGSIFLIAILLPFLAVGARRLRDANYSAWWLLALLIPVGGIVILVSLWAMPTANSLSEESQPA